MEGLGPPKSPMSLTAPGIKGVVTDFVNATPSVSVAFQAVSALGQIPKYTLEYVKKGFTYSALKTWNEIPLRLMVDLDVVLYSRFT